MGEEYKFTPDFATHPGETVKEKLEELAMSQKEFAVRVGKPEKTISLIINGKSAILPETAVLFEKVLDIPANYWLSHQAIFDEFKARKKREKKIQAGKEWTKKFPYSEMVKLGLVKPATRTVEKTEELLSFFNISSFLSWQDIYLNKRLPLLFRQSLKSKTNPFALSVLLRIAEREAGQMQAQPYNKDSFEDALPKLREIMNSYSEKQLAKIRELCAFAGVKIIFIPYLKKTNIYGVVRWVDGWPVVLMTDRNKRYDIF